MSVFEAVCVHPKAGTVGRMHTAIPDCLLVILTVVWSSEMPPSVSSAAQRCNLSKGQKKKLLDKAVQYLSETFEKISELGGHAACIVHGSQMKLAGTEKGLQFLEARAGTCQSFHLFTAGEPLGVEGRLSTADNCQSLQKAVQRLFNDTIARATNGKYSKVPYKAVAEKRLQVSISGLPEGLMLKHPSLYTKQELQRIVLVKDCLTFEVAHGQEDCSQQQHQQQQQHQHQQHQYQHQHQHQHQHQQHHHQHHQHHQHQDHEHSAQSEGSSGQQVEASQASNPAPTSSVAVLTAALVL